MSNEPLVLEQRLLGLLHGFLEEHGLEPEEGAENWCAELDEAFVKRLAGFINSECGAGTDYRRRLFRGFLDARGVEDPCGRCDGLGVRAYSSTSAWRGGIGGQAITSGVCDECWGSGDSGRKWPSWRARRPDPSDAYALVTTAGDPSVGIPGAAVTIEGLPPGLNDIERRDARDLLAGAFSDLFGEPARVEFGDEIAALTEAEKEVR